MNVAIIIIINLLTLATMQSIKKHFNIPSYITRKSMHILSAIIVILVVPFLSQIEFLGITLLFTLLYTYFYFFKPLDSIEVADWKSFGSFLYPFSLFIMGIFLYQQPLLLQMGIALLGFPDATAGLVDFTTKTKKRGILGLCVYMLITCLILLINFSLPQVLLFAFILTAVEYFSPYGTDNITVPIVFILLVSF